MTENKKPKNYVIPGFIFGVLVLAALAGYRFGFHAGERETKDLVSRVELLQQKADESPYRAIGSVARIRKGAKSFNDSDIEYERLSRFRVAGKERYYTVENSDVSQLDSVMGWGVIGDSRSKFAKYLRPLFKCKEDLGSGGSAFFYSSSPNCGTGEVIGEKLNVSVFAHLVDPTFLPMYLCRKEKLGHYLTLNNICESEADRVVEVVGYVKAEKVNIE